MADGLLHVVPIAAGEFVMGAEDGNADERPSHRAYVDDFYLGVHPVTNTEYAQFVHDTGHPSPAIRALPLMVTDSVELEFRAIARPYCWTNSTPPEGRVDHPVTLVRFEDALAYCAWLSRKTSLPVRLPTEAEWERAARGGIDGRRFPWGDTFDAAHAHCPAQTTAKLACGTAAVGTYPPNAFDLYDMAGNVWEWVSDWYAPDYYGRSQYHNPQGPDRGLMRVVRGGAWVNADVAYFRCAYRHKVPPDSYSYSIGFRIAYSAR